METSEADLPEGEYVFHSWRAGVFENLGSVPMGKPAGFGFGVSAGPLVEVRVEPPPPRSGVWSGVLQALGRPTCVPGTALSLQADLSWTVLERVVGNCQTRSAPGAFELVIGASWNEPAGVIRSYALAEPVGSDVVHEFDQLRDYSVVETPGGGAVYVSLGDKSSALSPIFIRKSSQLLPVRSLQGEDREVWLRIQIRGDWLLVTEADGSKPRLFDLRAASLRWESATGQFATFWPIPEALDSGS